MTPARAVTDSIGQVWTLRTVAEGAARGGVPHVIVECSSPPWTVWLELPAAWALLPDAQLAAEVEHGVANDIAGRTPLEPGG